MRLLPAFRRDAQGATAIEFGLVAPILVAVLLLSYEGWRQVDQTMRMRTAVNTTARYYQMGGRDDLAAAAAGLSAWANRPSDGTLSVARNCACEAQPIACTTTCSTAPPVAEVAIQAQSTYKGAFQSRLLEQKERLRVR